MAHNHAVSLHPSQPREQGKLPSRSGVSHSVQFCGFGKGLSAACVSIAITAVAILPTPAAKVLVVNSISGSVIKDEFEGKNQLGRLTISTQIPRCFTRARIWAIDVESDSSTVIILSFSLRTCSSGNVFSCVGRNCGLKICR